MTLRDHTGIMVLVLCLFTWPVGPSILVGAWLYRVLVAREDRLRAGGQDRIRQVVGRFASKSAPKSSERAAS